MSSASLCIVCVCHACAVFTFGCVDKREINEKPTSIVHLSVHTGASFLPLLAGRFDDFHTHTQIKKKKSITVDELKSQDNI